VRIVFERFRKEPDSDKIYVLSNPSRNIPIWIEELSGIKEKEDSLYDKFEYGLSDW
jgi:hypothetical protein